MRSFGRRMPRLSISHACVTPQLHAFHFYKLLLTDAEAERLKDGSVAGREHQATPESLDVLLVKARMTTC